MDRVDYESLIIQDLLNFHASKALDINPWYQRRSVWSAPQKSYLINTIFEQKPVPSVYIRHQIDIDNEKSIKEVVDGQQRIRTIISYRADEFAAKHPNHRQKVTFSELSRAEKGQFLSTAMSVGYLIGADDRDVIEIFGRINSISKTLNPQEKRNAKYSGEFKQFSLRQASERLPFWRATGIFTATDISRMQEVQFISDLAINMIEGLVDFSATKLDRYYAMYDEDFPEMVDLERRLNFVFDMLAALPSELFLNTVFRQYQVAFSLMVVLDALRDNLPDSERLADAMRDLDARAMDDYSMIADMFLGANLHRIRTRAVRDEQIRAALV